MLVSRDGHLNVVNRLLDCKEIDVNVQNVVSGMFEFFTSHTVSKFSPLLFFLDMF